MIKGNVDILIDGIMDIVNDMVFAPAIKNPEINAINKYCIDSLNTIYQYLSINAHEIDDTYLYTLYKLTLNTFNTSIKHIVKSEKYKEYFGSCINRLSLAVYNYYGCFLVVFGED